MFDAIIFDKDQTLTDVSSSFRAEPDLVVCLQKLVALGKKLFIVSAIGPNPNMHESEWIELQKQKKIQELERAGLPSSFFTDIYVALPRVKTSFASYHEFANAKFEVMRRILEKYDLNPKNVLSFGDDIDVEGIASTRLSISFTCVRDCAHLRSLLHGLIESCAVPTNVYPAFGRRSLLARFNPSQRRIL